MMRGPALRKVLITASFFLIPFSALLIVMYIGFTPQYAAAVAILVATLLLFINGSMAVSLGSGMTRICDAAIMAGGQIAYDRIDYSMCINHHWRSWHNRSWNQGYVADFVFFGWHDLASLTVNRACLLVSLAWRCRQQRPM
jgi:hypothetical protein